MRSEEEIRKKAEYWERTGKRWEVCGEANEEYICYCIARELRWVLGEE